jgi:DNA-binding winged helix-turn-helix (wHTH) protein
MTNDRGGLQFGNFTLDVPERRLFRDGRPIPLPPKAFDVLAALAARPGRLMTKDELLKEDWPDSFVEESNLAYHVFALRRALGETADGESYVETIPKHGYRFIATVTPANGANGEVVVNSATLAPDASAGEPEAVDLVVAEHCPIHGDERATGSAAPLVARSRRSCGGRSGMGEYRATDVS